MTHDMTVSKVNTTSQIKEPAERKFSPSLARKQNFLEEELVIFFNLGHQLANNIDILYCIQQVKNEGRIVLARKNTT